MSPRDHKILFFGNERLATGVSTEAPVLQALHEAGYEITGVIVAQKAGSKSRKDRPLEIEQVAKHLGIPVFAPQNLKDTADEIANHKADIGVLVAYGKIVPQQIIDILPGGIVNIHPSLLPKHRGPTPLEGVILGAETETGVSLMCLEAKMDAGPIYAQERVQLDGQETKQKLAEQLLVVGKDMLIEHLPAILSGSLKPTPQTEDEASYDSLISKSSSELDFNKSAEQLEREVRAYAGWPRSWCKLGIAEVIVTQAHVQSTNGVPGTLWLDTKQVGIHAKQGILIFDRLIPAGKKEMSAHDFLKGYKLDIS